MKKYILTLIMIFTMIAAPALAGVWVAQSSFGPTCYLVKFATGNTNYPNVQLIGSGIVSGTSSKTFTGFLKFGQGLFSSYGYGTGMPSYNYIAHCLLLTTTAAGACAWQGATGGMFVNSSYTNSDRYGHTYSFGTVAVKDMPITSAQPTACW